MTSTICSPEEIRGYERAVLGLTDEMTEALLDLQYVQEAKDAGVEIAADESATNSQEEASKETKQPFTETLTRVHARSSFQEATFVEHESRRSLFKRLLKSSTTSPQESRQSVIATFSKFKLDVGIHSALQRIRNKGKSRGDSAEAVRCRDCPVTRPALEPLFHLDCGHSICPEHLLRTLHGRPCEEESTGCCGRSTPKAVLDELARRTQLHLGTALSQAEHRMPIDEDPQEVAKPPVIQTPNPNKESPKSFYPPDTEQARKNFVYAMMFEDFANLWSFHSNQKDNFMAFKKRSMIQVADSQSASREVALIGQRQTLETLSEDEKRAFALLEEKHLCAELDLLDAHKQDKRNCAVAIRHMEAYCNSKEEEGSARVVSANDYNELWRQCRYRDDLDRRHASEINVLRESQGRQHRKKVKQHQEQVAILQKAQAEHMTELDKSFVRDLQAIEKIWAARQQRLEARWEMAVKVWEAKHVATKEISKPFPLPSVGWT